MIGNNDTVGSELGEKDPGYTIISVFPSGTGFRKGWYLSPDCSVSVSLNIQQLQNQKQIYEKI